MTRDPAYFCWSCYGRNDHSSGPCAHCGLEISPPSDAGLTARLVWAMGHPDPDVAIMSTRRLAQLGDRSVVPTLREWVVQSSDPYLAAEALRSLLVLSTPAAEKELLDRLAADGPVLVRDQARQALAEVCG